MAVPASFAAQGFSLPARKFRRLMIGSDGPAGSGKTEFALSAPGPTIGIALDRGIDSVLDSPTVPPTRRNDYAFKVINAPQALGATKDQYLTYWQDFRDTCYKAVNITELRTLLIDGDSDSWELQRLAEFGKLTQIPSIMYTGVNTARRLFYSRLHDSGKIVIATNKVKKLYKPKLKADGTIEQREGKDVREWDGLSYDRQGFEDQDYLWSIQIRHLFDEEKKSFGLRIMKAKANRDIEGMELWGGDCNFAGLVQVVYPHIDLKEWGF